MELAAFYGVLLSGIGAVVAGLGVVAGIITGNGLLDSIGW